MQTLLNLAPGSSIISQYSTDATYNPTDSAQDMKIDDFLDHNSEQKMTPRLRMLSKVKRTYESKLAEGEPLDVHEQQELIDDVRSQNAFITDVSSPDLHDASSCFMIDCDSFISPCKLDL